MIYQRVNKAIIFLWRCNLFKTPHGCARHLPRAVGALGNRPHGLHGCAKCQSWEQPGERLVVSSWQQMVADAMEKPLLAWARPCGATSGIVALQWPLWASPRPGFSLRHRFRKSTCLSGDSMVLMLLAPQLLLLVFPFEELSTFSKSLRKDQTRSPQSWASIPFFPHLATW